MPRELEAGALLPKQPTYKPTDTPCRSQPSGTRLQIIWMLRTCQPLERQVVLRDDAQQRVQRGGRGHHRVVCAVGSVACVHADAGAGPASSRRAVRPMYPMYPMHPMHHMCRSAPCVSIVWRIMLHTMREALHACILRMQAGGCSTGRAGCLPAWQVRVQAVIPRGLPGPHL